ncbi:MAG: TonB-dependent receptor [bacterium]|nr:TonB-dependent receptor [bacterium]
MRICTTICMLSVLLAATAAPAQDSPAAATGRIEGRVIGQNGQGLAGVTVVVESLATELTGTDGGFAFEDLPPGTYRLELTLGNQVESVDGVEVAAGATATVEKNVDWLPSFGTSITVVSASRRRQQIYEAPAAISAILPEEIERQSAHGQLPKLLRFTPGIELTQSGIYDFNLNARGINTMLTRRILVLVDGRDVSMPLNGAQEWSSYSLPLYELDGIELLRGPSSALYGSNAVHGVLNMVTKVPREHQGGLLQLAGGEIDTLRIDARHAGELGADWYYRISGGHQSTGDFARSRVETVEYEGAPLEILPPASDTVETTLGSLRLDKYFGDGGDGGILTFDSGSTRSEGVIFLTPGGRFQVRDATSSWARLDYSRQRWNAFATYSARDADNIQLNTAGESYLDATRTQVEVHGNQDFAGGRLRLVGGASYSRVTVDSLNPQGIQTLLLEETVEDRFGAFAQLDYDISDQLELLLAARWDDGDRYDNQVSPKAALVWGFKPHQRLRFTYNEAFQAPNTVEFDIFFPVAESLDLSSVEEDLAPQLGGVPLGFSDVPFLALGNPSLDVEQIRTLELGYSGVLGGRHFLTIDVYNSELENFVSTFLPQLGTSLGRLNPNFGPYQPPAGLSPEASASVLTALEAELGSDLFATMSNYFDGAPIFATLTFTNLGEVETSGLEMALSSSLTRRLRLDASYAYIDFDIKVQVPENPILANAPENKFSMDLAYTGDRFDATVGYRWADSFEWSTGIFVGNVPSYGIVDFVGNYKIDDRWTVGLNISNLFDDEHYEAFGGDLVGRRAIASASFAW